MQLRALLTFALAALGALMLRAQEPTIASCDGVQRICVDDSNFGLCVSITVDPNFTAQIDSFLINWGDNSPLTVVAGGDNPEDQFHEYDLSDFYGSCEFEIAFNIGLETFTDGSDFPLFNGSRVIFRNPPISIFAPESDTICIGDVANFIDAACPEPELDISFDYGDGSPIGSEPSHQYNQAGTFMITQTVENPCGMDESTRRLVVIPNATAVGRPVAGVQGDEEPYIVCLGLNGGVVNLDGSMSQNQIDFEWTPATHNGFEWLTATDVVSPVIDFDNPGTYNIFLTVNNSCNRPARDTLTFKVIEAEPLFFNLSPDTCVAYDYTPEPLNDQVTYVVDGATVPASGFPVFLDAGAHIIRAVLANECGNQEITDTITIAPALDVNITAPANGLQLCAGSGAIPLQAGPSGGRWEGDHINQSGGEAFFIPSAPGTFTLTYRRGAGDCLRLDSVTIEVVDDITLSLTPQLDTCIAFEYTPAPFLESAAYIIDGNLINNGQFPVLLDFGVHNIRATLSNVCGVQQVEDNFTIAPAEEVFIRTPAQDTAVCVGSGAFELSANFPDGRWQGPNVSQSGPIATFNPVEPGTFTIFFSRGNGPCERRDSVAIEVQGVNAQVEDISACPWSGPIALTASPAGGEWSSPDCPGCVEGGNFVAANLPDGMSSVELLYAVANDIGCSSSATATISILEPIADFAISSSCLNEPAGVETSGAVGDTFVWRVDGEEFPPPPFDGLASGTHTVEMVAIIGQCRDSISEEVNIVAPPGNARFNIDRTRICPGESINFIPFEEEEDNRSYFWSFGREPLDTLNAYRPSGPLVFDNATDTVRTYEISFTVANECGSATLDSSINVVNLPTADIGIDSSRVGCSPFTVLFTNQSRGGPESCLWNIGENFALASCQDTFSFTFTATDSLTRFFISLTATNECGNSTALDTVRVAPPGVQALYNLDDIDYVVCPNDTIQFEDSSAPVPTQWSWDFGDGTFSALAAPKKVYNTISDTTVDVTLRVSSGCGYDEIRRQVTILPAPKVDFDLPPFGCKGQPVGGIVNRSPGNYISYVWDYGNGQVDSTAFSPVPTFDIGNTTYPVTLTVTDFPNECKNSLTKDLLIRDLPIADFLVENDDTIGCEALSGQLTNFSINANQLVWRFKGREVNNLETVGFSFGIPGDQPITLVASWEGVCVDSITKEVFVEECETYIPSAFSPNGDGNNDFFTVFGSNSLENVRMLRVMDRWGNQVFYREDFPANVEKEGWDGRVRGSIPNPAVFVYQAEVEFIGGIVKKYVGDVTLLIGE